MSASPPASPPFQSTLPARGATRFRASVIVLVGFQSTLPARGATHDLRRACAGCRHFNPRSPHGERPAKKPRAKKERPISIHAPRTGSDPRPQDPAKQLCPISIHAPRTGSDLFQLCILPDQKNFNPRSPHGERPLELAAKIHRSIFQSTLPARGATFGGRQK